MNKIKFMNGRTFASMNRLKSVWMGDNKCIDKDFDMEHEHLVLSQLTQLDQINCGFPENNPPFKFNCGKNSFPSTTIIGGTETIHGQWPFVAALRYVKVDEHFCGGTIITAQHVVTG